MNVAAAIAEMLKREGVEFLIGYPVNPIIEAAAEADIRTVIVRQERIGLHMADAVSRITSGETIGVFTMQHGPGTENAFGGVAQAYGESSPIVVLPAGYRRAIAGVQPNFSAFLNFQHVSKSVEQVNLPGAIADAMRRAFTGVRNGRPRPTIVEVPTDVYTEELPGELHYRPVPRTRSGPDPEAVAEVARVLIAAERPVIYAGQGVHYAKAWDALRELAELLEAPVTTSLGGKSAFPETHPLALGTAGLALPRPVHDFLQASDVIFGIGCSFTSTSFGQTMPTGKTIVHATLDAADINKDQECDYALVGDAELTLRALLAAIRLDNTVITHDAGSPRDQLSPFWTSTVPLSYLGWGKTTQLGYGLGLALGAKLVPPDKLCINVWGDAAIGFTGMDFETAVRERLPILSILFNNFSMAIELPIMRTATAKYRSTDISGNYADMAKAFGGYGERVTDPAEIIPAIKRGIAKTQEGTPVLLEFITAQETRTSVFNKKQASPSVRGR